MPWSSHVIVVAVVVVVVVVIGAVVIVSSSLSNHLGITDPTKGSSSLGIVVSVLGCLLLVIDNLREVIGELTALLVRELC